MSRPGELTKDRLTKVAKLFEELPNSKIIDVTTIRDTVSAHRDNMVQSNVYIKVVLINTLYRTAIIDNTKLANHIF
ncbi:MAG: hypothetical protein JXM79_10510 [Sedimentisphaerales bacterium]|nr:hypothetical protein [Sedimentisphaerales bacterium]